MPLSFHLWLRHNCYQVQCGAELGSVPVSCVRNYTFKLNLVFFCSFLRNLIYSLIHEYSHMGWNPYKLYLVVFYPRVVGITATRWGPPLSQGPQDLSVLAMAI